MIVVSSNLNFYSSCVHQAVIVNIINFNQAVIYSVDDSCRGALISYVDRSRHTEMKVKLIHCKFYQFNGTVLKVCFLNFI